MAGWIGVDLDGTLAEYHGWQGDCHIGEPIPKMLERVKRWMDDGIEVRIVTARVHPSQPNIAERTSEIIKWCCRHLKQPIPITCQKDFGMIELWDDRCVQVVPNTGERVDGKE
jgi:hypothetical protein